MYNKIEGEKEETSYKIPLETIINKSCSFWLFFFFKHEVVVDCLVLFITVPVSNIDKSK